MRSDDVREIPKVPANEGDVTCMHVLDHVHVVNTCSIARSLEHVAQHVDRVTHACPSLLP